MFLNLKKYIETNVNKLNSILILLITLIFPLNQQYHLRPFISVEGFIIDYLILKISAQEVIIFLILVLNLVFIIKFFRNLRILSVLLLFLTFIFLSVLNSRYTLLAFYDNLIWVLIVFCSILFIKKPEIIKQDVVVKSIKFWLIFLVILGCFQFLNQGSIFNNYHIFGEYPYSENNLFIKQRNTLLSDFVPSMGIFSHSNIFGAYYLFLLFLLRCFKKDRVIFHIFGVIVFLITGSLPVLIAYCIWFLLLTFPNLLNFRLIFLILFLNTFALFITPNLIDSKVSENNYSVFRRAYLLDISKEYFINNPLKFLFGFGYMNYFSIVKNDLWDYEIIRFFQPPHNIFIFIIWNYGFIFLALGFCLFYKIYKSGNFETKVFILLVLILGSFDHYIVTNHQIQILGILIPYSLISKNKV